MAGFRADPEGRQFSPLRLFLDGCPTEGSWKESVLQAFVAADFEGAADRTRTYALAAGIKRCDRPLAVGWFEREIRLAAHDDDQRRVDGLMSPLRDASSPAIRAFFAEKLYDRSLSDDMRSRAGGALQHNRSTGEVAELVFEVLEAKAMPWGWGSAVALVLLRADAQGFLTRLAELARRDPDVLQQQSVFGTVAGNSKMYINASGAGAEAMSRVARAIAEDEGNASATRAAARRLFDALQPSR